MERIFIRKIKTYLSVLAAVALAVMFILPAVPVRAEVTDIVIPVQIKGGGTAKIEGCEYVPREDPEQESYAAGWNKVNGSALMPAQSTITVPKSSGESSFNFSIDAQTLEPGNMYTYKITQVPGTDPKTKYDNNEYLLEIYVTDLDGVHILTAQMRDDDAPGGEADAKPDACVFKNVKIKGPTGTPDYTIDVRGKKQYGRVKFKEGSGRIVLIQLFDPETGQPTDKKTVNAYDKKGNIIGTYTLLDDGRIEFAPIYDFVGLPEPVWVRATDENGLYADTFYQPEVIDKETEPTDPTETTVTQPSPTPPQPTTPDKKSPKTGDVTKLMPYIVIGGVAVLIIIFLVIFGILKKRSNKKEG